MSRKNMNNKNKNKKKNRKSARRISVVISGMPSVGKTTAAEAISKRFGLKHIAGGDMLKEMAIERGYAPSGSDWWDSKEGMKFLSERRTNPRFDQEVDERLISCIRRGGVVVTSYTVPWLCKDGLKIWFAASQETRARRLASRDQIGFRKALEIIKQRDNRNRRLYAKIYKMRFGKDLGVFNYIIDTEKLDAREVAEAATQLVRDYKECIGRKRK